MAGRIVFLGIETQRPIPSVATIPLVLIIVGFGYRLEIIIVAYAAFWPILILTESAMRLIERAYSPVSRLSDDQRVQDRKRQSAGDGGSKVLWATSGTFSGRRTQAAFVSAGGIARHGKVVPDRL